MSKHIAMPVESEPWAVARSGFGGWLGKPMPEGAFQDQVRNLSNAIGVNPSAAVEAPGRSAAVAVTPAESSGVMETRAGIVCWKMRRKALERLLGGRESHAAVWEEVLGRFSRDPAECFREIEGPFAMAVLVPARQEMFLAVDKIGIQSLFYEESTERVVFCSDLRTLRELGGGSGGIEDQAIFNYLYMHVIPSPGTVFKGVKSLPPGCWLHYKEGRQHVKSYWAVQYSNERGRINFRQAKAEFRDILRDGVANELNGEARVGCFLSGGTDSSTVAGLLGEVTGRPAQAFSIGFEAEGFDEVGYARIASERFGCDHHVYYVTPKDVAELVPRIATAYGQPFGNSSAVPTYFCAKLAREVGVTRLLGGDGGDELFGGNERYAKQKLFEAYSLLPIGVRKPLIEPMVSYLSKSARMRTATKADSYIKQANIPLPDRLSTYNFLDRFGPENVFEPGFLECVTPSVPKDIQREIYRTVAAECTVNKMLGLDLKVTLADNDLPKVTIMSELAGVSVGYPFLTERVVSFAGRLPVDQKVKGLRLRHFFKEALADYLPQEILKKRKHGFGLPFGKWVAQKGDLRDVAVEYLRSFKSRGIVRPGFIDELLGRRLSEHANYYGTMVWILMILEMWIQSDQEHRIRNEVDR
jgi:asparagine synthase (glutamine-hydrolysing)